MRHLQLNSQALLADSVVLVAEAVLRVPPVCFVCVCVCVCVVCSRLSHLVVYARMSAHDRKKKLSENNCIVSVVREAGAVDAARRLRYIKPYRQEAPRILKNVQAARLEYKKYTNSEENRLQKARATGA